MSWIAPTMLDMPEFADQDTKRQIWEQNRKQHNWFATQYNTDLLNRLFGRRIEYMPSYDEVVSKFKEQ